MNTSGCIHCGCLSEFDEANFRICVCDPCVVRGCTYLVEGVRVLDNACWVCGCLSQWDDQGEKVCWCDSCKREGCFYDGRAGKRPQTMKPTLDIQSENLREILNIVLNYFSENLVNDIVEFSISPELIYQCRHCAKFVTNIISPGAYFCNCFSCAIIRRPTIYDTKYDPEPRFICSDCRHPFDRTPKCLGNNCESLWFRYGSGYCQCFLDPPKLKRVYVDKYQIEDYILDYSTTNNYFDKEAKRNAPEFIRAVLPERFNVERHY